MHREPRGAESAEIASREVRLYVPRGRSRGFVGAGKMQYPRTFSALRSSRGVLCPSIGKPPEAKWNSVFDAFALFGAEAFLCGRTERFWYV